MKEIVFIDEETLTPEELQMELDKVTKEGENDEQAEE